MVNSGFNPLLDFLGWLDNEQQEAPFIHLCSNKAGFPGDSDTADAGLIPGSGRSPEKEWLPTPVFLTGEFHGQRSLAGHSPCSCKESDMTEQRTLSIHFHDSPQWELLPSSWGQQPSHTDGVLGKIYRNPHWPNCFWIQCLHSAEIISKAHRGQCSKDVWKTWSQESSGPGSMPSSAPWHPLLVSFLTLLSLNLTYL